MKTAYIIGRFQPFHHGHMSILKKAEKDGVGKIVILIGSANRSVSVKNPFTYDQRVRMIKDYLISNPIHVEVEFQPVNDYTYNDTLWIREVYSKISDPSNALIYGYKKDLSSDYLDWFPGVKLVEVSGFEANLRTRAVMNATDIRNNMFETISGSKNPEIQARAICYSLGLGSDDFQFLIDLTEEYQYIKEYKEKFSVLPYEPTFVTADAVVVQSGHILLVKRGGMPGKGLWALPGGFLNANTDGSMLDCAVRELVEETEIKLQEKILRKSVIDTKVFDSIGRSSRGRTVTHAFLFRLEDDKPLPKVKGQDDAVEAQWVNLSDLNPCDMFEDHMDIISHFVAV